MPEPGRRRGDAYRARALGTLRPAFMSSKRGASADGRSGSAFGPARMPDAGFADARGPGRPIGVVHTGPEPGPRNSPARVPRGHRSRSRIGYRDPPLAAGGIPLPHLGNPETHPRRSAGFRSRSWRDGYCIRRGDDLEANGRLDEVRANRRPRKVGRARKPSFTLSGRSRIRSRRPS